VALGIVALIKFNFDYLLVVGVAVILNAANIVGFTKCRKGTSLHPVGFLNFVEVGSFIMLRVALGSQYPSPVAISVNQY